MAMAFVPLTVEHTDAVRAFNQRLLEGGADAELTFPDHPLTRWLPNLPGRAIYQEPWIALDGNQVRGGFILKRQPFLVAGQERTVTHYKLPLSEGIVNKAYVMLGLQLLRQAQKIEPGLFALGMGGADRPLPRLLKSAGWPMAACPFYFRVQHPSKFLREIRALRGSPARSVAATLGAWSGLGWLAVKTLHAAKTKLRVTDSARAFEGFSGWADETWAKYKAEYSLIAVRNRETLDLLYPAASGRFLCYRIGDGWAVLLDTQMTGHKQFGDLRVGTIVDALGDPRRIIPAASEVLAARGVDLIISNQLDGRWGQALRDTGFLAGPSNFLFAVSKPLGPEFQFDTAHINRGDGDGPIHL